MQSSQNLIVHDYPSFQAALSWLQKSQNDIIAFDTETTGLNVRKDKVIGFGFSNQTDAFYVPILTWTGSELAATGIPNVLVRELLQALSGKKLITWNASFDMRITLSSLGVDLLPALHADVLLMKHTCDEEMPFGLKDVGAMLYGENVKAEKEEMQMSIKANGGTVKQYFKADTTILAKYCAQDCLLTFRLYNHYLSDLERQGLSAFYFTEEVLPLYKHVTIPMESKGIKLDMPKLLKARDELHTIILRLGREICSEIDPMLGKFKQWFLNKEYPMATPTGKVPFWQKHHPSQEAAYYSDEPNGTMFNLSSKVHLKKLLFEELRLNPLSRTPTGLPQVDDEFIQTLHTRYPWACKLTEYNSLSKLKGTYYDRFIDEQEDGIFYPRFMQHRTVSGRYSGDLQQLPRPLPGNNAVAVYTSMVRSFFVARENHQFIGADYESLEPKVFAHTSSDIALQNIFNQGDDFYSTVAIRTERLQGVSATKTAENYLGKLQPNVRQRAKVYSLGIAYGLTAYKLKFELGISEDEAKVLVNDYLTAFPQLAAWMQASKDFALQHGYVKSQAGRIRHLGRAKAIYEKYGTCILDDLELWKAYNTKTDLYAQAKLDRKVLKNELNNSINFQVQSFAASIVNQAAIALAKLGHVPSLQCHDELLYEVPENLVKIHANTIQNQMENVTKISVPLVAQPKIGDSYAQCK